MTDLEQIALQALYEVRDHFTDGKPVKARTYMDVMGVVRDAIKKLENKIGGCPTGMHSGNCTCRPAVLGRSANAN